MVLLELFELIERIFVAFSFDLSINPSLIDCGIFIIPRFLLPYKPQVAIFHTNMFLDDLRAILDPKFLNFVVWVVLVGIKAWH